METEEHTVEELDLSENRDDKNFDAEVIFWAKLSVLCIWKIKKGQREHFLELLDEVKSAYQLLIDNTKDRNMA